MTNENRRNPRSNSYQFLLNEISVAPDLLDSFSSQDNLYKRLSPFDYSETILDLEEQLRQAFWRLIKENLNEKQQRIVKILSEGATQTECAEEIGLNQSSIAKFLSGSVELDAQTGTAKTYGGIKKKLRAAMENDQPIKDLLQKISDLRDDTWIKE